MSLAQALEQAASALAADADSIRPANGDPIQLLELLDSAAAVRVLTWLLTHEVEAGEELAVGWSDEETGLDLLAAVEEGALPKAGKKVFRRLRHRLRSRGVEFGDGEAPQPVVGRLPEIRDRIDLAYVGALDPRGSQLVYLVEGKAGGGARLFEIVLDELRGVVRFEIYSASRSKLRRFTRELEDSSSMTAAEADSAAVRALVSRIAAGHPSDRPFPSSFSEWRVRLSEGCEEGRTPGQIAREALAGSLPENALESIADEIRQGQLDAWPGDAGAMEAVGKQLQETTGGVAGATEEDRDAAFSAASRELFDERFAAKTGARFEESAFVAWKSGREDAARARLAAADAFRAEAPGDNPVARALVEVYFSSLLAG